MTPSEIIEKYGLAVGLIIFALTFWSLEVWPFLKNKVYEDARKHEERRLQIAEQQNDVLIRLEGLFSQSVQRTIVIDERTESIYSAALSTNKLIAEHRRDSQRPFEQIDELHSKLINKVSS